MTNNDIFNLVNFYLRKSKEAEPISVEQFRSLLIQESYNHFKELYPLYEKDQRYKDRLNPFVNVANVTTLNTTTNTIDVPILYAHFVGMYYTDDINKVRAFDIVTDDEWDMRIRSTLSVPTDEYPICKVSGDKIYVYPEFSGTDTSLKIYYGSGAVGLSVASIQLLSSQSMTNGTKKFSYSPSTEVYYVAYPALYGTLVSILDTNGYDTISDWTLSVENFSGTNYNVYEFNNLTTQTGFYNTFKF
jgi:hypothetical protein